LIQLPIVHVGVDECGSLTSLSELFTVAAVVTPEPEPLRNLIRRVAFRSGKRLQQRSRVTSEFKWRNTSDKFRANVLRQLAETEVNLFALTIHKESRQIADTPENYATLTCALLDLLWHEYPNVALSLDKHFTSPSQIAVVDTFIHRRWPQHGILTISHVDSELNPIVQMADFVAGAVYAWQKEQNEAYRVIEDKISVAAIEHWSQVKAHWLSVRK